MPVWYFYVDESHDDDRFCLSALMVRHSEWKESFLEIQNHRKRLKNDHGIFISKEIHARDLVSGRGRISPGVIGKWERTRIFFGLLQLIARLPSVKLFNICLPKTGRADPQLDAWDRLVNRIERTMQEFENRELGKRRQVLGEIRGKIPEEAADYLESRLGVYRSRAFIIADEGRAAEITRVIRKMHVFNLVPSQFGEWSPGVRTKNITTDRLIEDPVLKPSHRSYFIQLADCIAFALLKREAPPTPLVLRYGLHKMFDQALAGVCFQPACKSQKHGIVRG